MKEMIEITLTQDEVHALGSLFHFAMFAVFMDKEGMRVAYPRAVLWAANGDVTESLSAKLTDAVGVLSGMSLEKCQKVRDYLDELFEENPGMNIEESRDKAKQFIDDDFQYFSGLDE